MKLTEMKAIKENRHNIIGFLHFAEIQEINANLVDFDADKKSFYVLCDEVISQYQAKKISNKKASQIFDILMTANKSIRTERFRFAHNEIYEWDAQANAYMFRQNGRDKAYNELVAKFGKYVD